MPTYNQNMNLISADMLVEASKRLNYPWPDEIKWWAWPCCFPDESGPQASGGPPHPTFFQIYGFQRGNARIKQCNGLWKDWDGKVGSPW